ncbi:MAG: MFS transporter [Pirellulaceae bacterium]|nr:MFS transporter [Pirellulaceae bacterium]MDP6554195.1 MFS transporter [Pirellulaceae bacterium]
METADLHLTAETPTRRRRVIFLLAAGTSFMLYLHRYTWVMVRPELKAEYEFSETQLEGLYTLFNVTYALGQIPGGIVCDFFGPHMFLGIIIALWSLALPTVGLTGSLNGLGASRLAFGAAQSGCYPSLAKVTRLWFPLKGRTALQGLIASFFGRSGGAVSTVIFGAMLGVGLSWRSSLFILSSVGLAFAFLFYRICRNRPEEDPAANQAEVDLIREGEPDSQDGPRVLPFRRAVRNRSLLVFIVQQFMNAGADYVYSAIMASYFIEARNVSDKFVLGLLASVPLWGGALGGIAGGFINDGLIAVTANRRLSRSIVGFSGKTIACVCLYLSITHPEPMVGASLLFATKFFSDWSQPTVWGTSTDMGGRYSATVFSIINSAGSVGGVVTPLLGGFLLDRYATQSDVAGKLTKIVHYEPVFIMVGIMYLMSATCWLFIDCTNSLDRPEYTGTVDGDGTDGEPVM